MNLDLLTRFDAEAAEMVRSANEDRAARLDRSNGEREAVLSVLRHAKGLRVALATLRQESINAAAGGNK